MQFWFIILYRASIQVNIRFLFETLYAKIQITVGTLIEDHGYLNYLSSIIKAKLTRIPLYKQSL